AIAVNVPIVLAYAEYAQKEVHIGDVFYPSGDFEKDFDYMERFFKNVTAAFPDEYNTKIFDRKDP
ncbi:MAG: hypothetical protein ACI9GM_001454, partial [Salibacteraceae bacterium]